MSYGLTRRALLRALGTTAVALPVLELTAGSGSSAQSGEKPKRLVVMYGGLSQSRSNSGNLMKPSATGAGYDLPRGLASIGAGQTSYGQPGYDVQDRVSVVSGLKIPWGPDGQIPPGGKSVEFHYNSGSPQVTGIRRGDRRRAGDLGTSVDFLVADAIGQDSIHQSLLYRVQAARYLGSNSDGGLDSLNMRREGGNVRRYDSVVSPRLAYQSLFSGFVPPEEAGRGRALSKQSQRRSILSIVRNRTQGILPKLGRWDQIRMERHFDELRALEGRLAALPEPGTGACAVPMELGEDPPIGADQGTRDNGNLRYIPGNGWSDETTRGNSFCDLVKTAFACDLSRVVSMRLTLDQTFMGALQPIGAEADFHEMTHGSAGVDSLSDGLSWHAGFFARLTAGLRDTLDADGTPILDSTAIVLLFEGGHGFDPESNRDNSPHSTENMVALVSGGLFNEGVHIETAEEHPAKVFNSVLPAFGLPETLGEISGKIDGLS